MSYLDQTNRSRPKTIAAVAILHAGLGYLIVSGLAYTVITQVPRITIANNYGDDTPPPPPHDDPPPPQTNHSQQTLQRPEALVPTNQVDVTAVDLHPFEPVKPTEIVPTVITPQPPRRSLARGAEAGPGRGGWVTSDDYPPQPLREGVTGVVGISVAIAADGHVQNCAVTKSSGNAQLDDATCRIYARRAKFKPALDADGKPTTAQFTDRIRWQLPAE